MSTSGAPERERHPQGGGAQPGQALFSVATEFLDSGKRRQWLDPQPRVLDADRTVALGALCVVADAALGGAALRAISSEERTVTTSLQLIPLRRPTISSGRIYATGEPTAKVTAGVITEGVLSDDSGVVALCNGRFAVLSAGHRSARHLKAPPPSEDPMPPVGDGHPMSGAPVHETLRLRKLEAGPGRARLTLNVGDALGNDRAGVHGGIGALIGEQATREALRSVAADSDQMTAVELRVSFVRPVPADGRRVECHAEVLHAGRSLAVTRANLLDATGRLAVIVDVLYGLQSTDHEVALPPEGSGRWKSLLTQN